MADLTTLYKDNEQGITTLKKDNDYLQIAENTLKNIGFDLSDFDKGIVTDILEQGTVDDLGKPLAKSVYFYKKFKGVPLLGTSRIVINIGCNGEIQSISKLFKEIDNRSYKLKLKSIDKAIKALKEDNNAVINYKGHAQNIKISSVKIRYWEDPQNDYLQPVYCIIGSSMDTDSELFEGYVPAIEENQFIN